jgi:hypothetical protein
MTGVIRFLLLFVENTKWIWRHVRVEAIAKFPGGHGPCDPYRMEFDASGQKVQGLQPWKRRKKRA